jgi:hypothetical protein
MSNPIIQRINTIEREMVGEMDLSHIARERVEPDLLRQCVKSGQVDSRQIAAHIKASELDGIGNECALPIVVNDIKRVRQWNWPLIGYVSAAIVGAWFLYLIATKLP